MAKYRNSLPQLSDRLFLTDGGIETSLIFLDGFELPSFAAFVLLDSEEGRAGLRSYFRRYAQIARDNAVGFIFESPTWRASTDWGSKLGYANGALADFNRRSIAMMAELRQAFETPTSPMVISGCIGPRGDGYDPGRKMSAAEAEAYHTGQANVFRDTEADMITAITMTNAEEAIGLARASRNADMPVAISFTTETDGRLPTGQSIKDAIELVDSETASAPVYYMLNCAHPTHFEAELAAGGPWTQRIRGLRANASTLSHAELDNATDLDAGDPVDLAQRYRGLRKRLPNLSVLGGCCGTDHRHVEQICLACVAA
jgi:S-methylmethionine-dependent homocysteine/selenocysteine methylase